MNRNTFVSTIDYGQLIIDQNHRSHLVHGPLSIVTVVAGSPIKAFGDDNRNVITANKGQR